jgi:hypothetical protein
MKADDFFAAWRERPILLSAVCVVWLFEAAANAGYGFRANGGGLYGCGYALLYIALAVIGSWLTKELLWFRGVRWLDWGYRVVLVLAAVMCVGWSQFCGWNVAGVSLADGALARKFLATGASIAAESVDQLREDRKRLGTQPAPEQVQTRIEAALAIIDRATGRSVADLSNKCANPSGAPYTCRQVAKIHIELADAKRAQELDDKIKAASGSLSSTQAVAAGTPEFDVIKSLTGATDDSVKFWRNIFFVALIGLGANFGFAIAMPAPAANPAPAPEQQWQWGPPRLAPPAPKQHAEAASAAGDDPRRAPAADYQTYTQRATTATPAAPAGAAGYGGSPTSHGAPIHINVGMPQGQQTVLPPLQPTPGAQVYRPQPGPDPFSFQQLQPVPQMQAVAHDGPTDRDRMRMITDNLLIFRAHTLANAAGGAVPADAMYARYCAWAGSRAIPREAFDDMFPATTGVDLVPVDGVPHYAGVLLKSASRHMHMIN